jgi:hypothetical protein
MGVVCVTSRPRFTPAKRPTVPIEQEAGWASEPFPVRFHIYLSSFKRNNFSNRRIFFIGILADLSYTQPFSTVEAYHLPTQEFVSMSWLTEPLCFIRFFYIKMQRRLSQTLLFFLAISVSTYYDHSQCLHIPIFVITLVR